MISELSYYMHIPLELHFSLSITCIKRVISFSIHTVWDVYYHVFYSFITCTSAPIVGLYLLMCVIAPQIMKLFRPFDLRWPLVIHNIICTILSAYCLMCFIIAFTEDRDLFSTTTSSTGILRHAMFIYWMTKWYELLDTVFMILRHSPFTTCLFL